MDEFDHITDETLDDMIARVREVYQQANQEATDRLLAFLEQYRIDDERMQSQLEAGQITQDEFDDWRRSIALQSAQYEAVQVQISNDLINADKIAAGIVNGELPDIYALNMNGAQFDMCRQMGYDFDPTFALVDRFTVNRLIADGDSLFPTARIDESEDSIYTRRHIQNSITQGILQGDSIEKIAERMTGVTQMSYNSAVRTARTLTTAAQNSGRVDSYYHAQSLGIDLQQEWMATLDPKTRDSHRDLDGVRVEVGQRFPNGCRFPGDPTGPAGEIYNCRCTLVAALRGYQYHNEDRWQRLPEDMTYEEWRTEHLSQTDNYSDHVIGNDISGTWIRRPEQFQFAIQDVINAQGFDGMPRVVDPDEFDAAVNESGIIMRRTYSAPDAETLELYRQSLYTGEWYVDCSYGDAWFGRGMYTSASYDGTISKDILRQEELYRSNNNDQNRWIAAHSAITQDQLISSYPEVMQSRMSFTQDDMDLLYRNWENRNNTSSFRSTLTQEEKDRLSYLWDVGATNYYEDAANDNFRGRNPNFVFTGGSYTETMTLSPTANIVDYEDIIVEYASACNVPVSEVDWRAERDMRTAETQFEDVGTYAALRGYDAIRVNGVEEAGRVETVVLNRTAVIIRRDS